MDCGVVVLQTNIVWFTLLATEEFTSMFFLCGIIILNNGLTPQAITHALDSL